MGCPGMNAVFDTNIVIDALNGVPEVDGPVCKSKIIQSSTW